MKIINLGGTTHSGRIYLEPCQFAYDNTIVKIEPTIKPNVDMDELIARHKARYYLVKAFIRPNNKVLDFPCGSGYGIDILKDINVFYDGLDYDNLAIRYAQKVYGNYFHIKNMCKPQLRNNYYNVIGCIEGLEHIDKQWQYPLIKAFHRALRDKGILVITTPEAKKSGKSKNPYHLWELTKKDFLNLLKDIFGINNVELITQQDILHTGELGNLLFGVCHKKEE